MEIKELEIPDVLILEPRVFEDHRGFFSETYNKKTMSLKNINLDFVQDNHSFSKYKGTLRGLHFQVSPFAQDKLVRVIQGSILDVAVDIRTNSPTYGKYVSAIIDSDNFKQILVPVGFAHGFLTLEDNTEVIYKVSEYYSPESERGIIWNDSDLNIDWSFPHSEITLLDRDKTFPRLKDIEDFFKL